MEKSEVNEMVDGVMAGLTNTIGYQEAFESLRRLIEKDREQIKADGEEAGTEEERSALIRDLNFYHDTLGSMI